MLDNKKRAEIEQAQATMAETLPPLLAGVYRNLQREDVFSADQAWQITLVLSFAISGGKGMLS